MGAGASTTADPFATLFAGEAASNNGINFQQLESAVADLPDAVKAQWDSVKLKTTFDQHDSNGDGLLSRDEYEAALAGSSGKDFGRDLPGAAEAAGARQETEEAIDTAMMAAVPARRWDAQAHDDAHVAVALSLMRETKAAFVESISLKKATNVESMFIETWQCLGRGDVDGALQLADTLLAGDKTNEKYYYTRAVCHARKASWRMSLADYSMYLKLVQTISGPALANALYGRALCLAKLGQRDLALRDLDECIRVGPQDEQLTEPDASLVPMAVVARFCLLQACPELRKRVEKGLADKAKQEAAKPTSLAAAAQQAAAEKASSATSYDDPKLWVVEVTELEVAIEKALSGGRTPLLIDGTRERAVDAYYMYTPSAVVEAKKLVIDVRVAGMPVESAREQLRESLVHAMRWGLTLLIRLSNSAADFKATYCSDEYFPLAVFDRAKLPSGQDAAADPIFSKVLRAADVQREGGRLHVPASFRVCVASHFKADAFERLLKDVLPLEHLQPMHIMEKAAATRVAQLPGAAGDGGESKPLLKGQIAEMQLTGDRTSLVLQGIGLDSTATKTVTMGELQQGGALASTTSYSAME